MTRAEEKSLELYPVKERTNKTGTGTFDPNLPRRVAYIQGYIQAEKDQKENIIEKEVSISPGVLSNFGPSHFVIDVELSQEEQQKLSMLPGFGTSKIKIVLG